MHRAASKITLHQLADVWCVLNWCVSGVWKYAPFLCPSADKALVVPSCSLPCKRPADVCLNLRNAGGT